MTPHVEGGNAMIRPGTCRECGCTDDNACVDLFGFPCSFVKSDLCSECYLEDETPLDLGLCCACREQPANSIMMLQMKSPRPGNGGWCCFQCNLPTEGAVAYLCGGCIGDERAPAVAAIGPLDDLEYINIDELTEYHSHDLWLHPEIPKTLADFPLDQWLPAADVCNRCGVGMEVRILNFVPDEHGGIGDVEWRVDHAGYCPEITQNILESGGFDGGFDLAGWEIGGMMVGLDGRNFPGLISRSNVGPCLNCWRLIIVQGVCLLGDEFQLDFCQRCTEKLKIFAEH